MLSNPAKLAELTPSDLRFRMTCISTEEIEEGTELEHAPRVKLVALRWRSRISAWQAPARCVDEQLAGPDRSWVQGHTFRR